MEIKHILAFGCMLLFAVPAFSSANGADSDQDSGKVKIYPIGKIKTVRITSADAKNPLDKNADCGDLKLDEKRVRFFIKHSRASNRWNFRRDLIDGDCAGQARVTFTSGRSMTLRIYDASGWGVIDARQNSYVYICELCPGILSADFDFSEMPK
jgi:hypothetical protein